MDIVNEIVDTYIGDHIYAYLLPLRPTSFDFPQPGGNASAQLRSPWQYEPATKMISFTPSEAAYLSAWPRDNIYRQSINLFLMTWLFGAIIYFVFATLSYVFVFDKATFKHPKYLKNQIWLEIKQTNISMPYMSLMTLPLFLAELRGLTKLYDTTADGPGRWYDFAQFPLFLFFTDFAIYWIHRGLHHPRVYKHLHKAHHKWIMPTPYAAYAFHPIDGFMQGLPYHLFPIFFPLQKMVYIIMFVFVNVWTVIIHDGEYVANSPVINGAACHTMHHLYFNYNYGQYTTLWDRLGGSYRQPDLELFHKETKNSDRVWKEQIREMEKMVAEVEGVDDRTYDPVSAKKDN